jgi:putative hydrolase of the HAD superfamily
MRLRPKSLERVNPALVVAAGVAAYHDTKFLELAPFDDVYPLLRDLKRAGVRLGIVTHGWTVKQAEKLVRLGLVPYLDPKAVFISDQIGISKPNPKLYQLALSDMGLAPAEVMYIGDSPEHDIAPPKSIGMVATWARRASRHKDEQLKVQPDHVVDDFDQLRPILRRDYGLPLS